jgi:DNA-binding GntR family transcriptional regulator
MSVAKSSTARKRQPQQLSVEQVAEKIRSAILRGELRPGAKLTEQDMAEEFEVSRTPIREAIRQLEVERLLTRVPFVGVTVRQLNPEEVLELLQTSLRRLTESARKGDVPSYLDHALAFRRALVECCRSESLAENVLVIENRLRLVGNRTAVLPGRMEASITEHEKLLAAITRGDAALAERLNRERIQHIRDAFAQSTAFSFL